MNHTKTLGTHFCTDECVEMLKIKYVDPIIVDDEKSNVLSRIGRKKNVECTSKKLGRSNNPIELIFYSRETSQPSYSFCPTQMGGEAKGEANTICGGST